MIGAPRREDFWRLRPATGTERAKEWHHFVVFALGCELIVNFSLIGTKARVIVLVRTERWRGVIESSPASEAAVTPDGCSIATGDHRMVITDDGYRLAIATADRSVTAALILRSQTISMAARSQPMGRGRLHWALYARLAVTGDLAVDGQSISLDGSLAYHDHNWGDLSWGDNSVWEWGAMLPTDPEADWAIVYSRLLDRARSRVSSQHMLVWRGPLNVLVAGGADVTTRERGTCQLRPELRLPAPMALLQPRIDADIPRRLEVTAARGRHQLSLAFTPRSLAQLLIPAETSLRGVVTINECTGTCRAVGILDDEIVEWEGSGVFEFVRG